MTTSSTTTPKSTERKSKISCPQSKPKSRSTVTQLCQRRTAYAQTRFSTAIFHFTNRSQRRNSRRWTLASQSCRPLWVDASTGLASLACSIGQVTGSCDPMRRIKVGCPCSKFSTVLALTFPTSLRGTKKSPRPPTTFHPSGLDSVRLSNKSNLQGAAPFSRPTSAASRPSSQ